MDDAPANFLCITGAVGRLTASCKWAWTYRRSLWVTMNGDVSSADLGASSKYKSGNLLD